MRSTLIHNYEERPLGIRRRVDHLLGGDIDEVAIVFSLIGANPGTMLDVGAHFGSSLAPFLAQGWSVHAFEPDAANRAILTQNYPGADVDPRAVSEVDGESVTLFTSSVSTGISSLSPLHPSRSPTAIVQTVRLDTYLRERAIEKVDFLKTDIEGFDLAALRTFPWDSHHPRAVVCEFEDRKTVPLGHDKHDTARFLQEQGYLVMVSEWEPIIEYGTVHRWRRFAHYPDDIPSKSWGNLIAVETTLLSQLVRASRSAARKLNIRRRLRGTGKRSRFSA